MTIERMFNALTTTNKIPLEKINPVLHQYLTDDFPWQYAKNILAQNVIQNNCKCENFDSDVKQHESESHGLTHAINTRNLTILALNTVIADIQQYYEKLHLKEIEKNKIDYNSEDGIFHIQNNIKNYKNRYLLEIEIIIYIAFCHDLDDSKYSQKPQEHSNTRAFLNKIGKNDEYFVNEVIKGIDCVSYRKNKNNLPEEYKDRLWMLIPRYADRLEAIGYVGLFRSCEFTKEVGMKIIVDDTPEPKDYADIWNYATEERTQRYYGTSASMIDHYFDKLLIMTKQSTFNQYLDKLLEKRTKVVLDFIIKYSQKTYKELAKSGELTIDHLIELTKQKKLDDELII